MNFKSLFIGAFALLVGPLSFAQSSKMGQINDNEFALTDVSYEPGADAVVLAEFGETQFFGDVLETKYFVRLKILTEAGKEYGDIRIRFFSGDDRVEEISGIKAQITNLENSKPQVTKVEKDGIFLVDLPNGMKEYRISFPNVQIGSIIEYQYKKSDKNQVFLDGWTFQNPIPTLYSEYQIKMIPQLQYKMMGQGYFFTSRAESSNSDGLYTWKLRNLYSSKEEPYMKNYRDYVDRIEFQLSQYQKYDPVRGVELVDYLDTWQKLGDGVIDYYKDKGYYRSNPIERELVAFDISGNTQREIAEKAYYYLRDNFQNEGEDWIYPEKTLNQLLNSKTGSPGELVLALMGILKSVGIECDPVLIGSKGYGRSELVPFPFLNQFDEILLLTKLDGELQFLDLSDPLAPFGYVDLDKHVKAGLLLKEEESSLVPITIRHNSNSIYFSQIELDSAKNLVMKNSIRNSIYRGLNTAHLVKRENNDPGFLKELLAGGNPNEEIKNIQIEDELASKNIFTINFERVLPNFGEAETLIFNPLQYSSFAENPFTQDFRIYPVDFEYSFNETYNANIQIPEGYEVDDYPLAENISIQGDYIRFSFQPSIMDNMLKITARLEVRNPLIPVQRYGDLKFFMESVAAKLSAPVVLKKVANP